MSKAGYPVRIAELLSTLDGVAYVERVTCDSTAHIRAAKKAIKKAFQNQIDGIGYSATASLRLWQPAPPTGA